MLQKKLFLLDHKECVVKKINESVDDFNLFGLVIGPDGAFNMNPVNELLHFNNDYPHVST